MKVLIAGGGIGGLTTALSLHAAGITDVTVLEAVREIQPLGVGINLLPHAVRELTELGLGDRLASSGVATADLTYVDRYGSQIWSEPRGLAAGYRWPQYSIHRGRLQLLLLEATIERLGPQAVATGVRVQGTSTSGLVARVEWGDARGTVHHDDADVVIACDGIKSTVRAQRFPREGAPDWNGSIMWRATSRVKPFLTGASMLMAGDRKQKFVAYPIEPIAADGSCLVNWIAERSVEEGALVAQDWNRQVDAVSFAPAFDSWRFDVLDVPALIRSAEVAFEYPMVDRCPLDSWVEGRVALLGDAAHPTYPVGSNGSSQAIIDARVLAYALATMPIDDGLRFYERERIPKTRELQRINRELGPERVMELARQRAPQGFTNIDDVVPHDERVEIASTYKRVAGFEPATLNERPSWSVGGSAA